MKKFNLVVALLLVLSVSVFAVDVNIAASLSGDASVTWGVDLNTNQTGFQNAASAKATVTFIAEQTESKGGDPITGFITLKVAEAKADSAGTLTVPGVSVEAAQIKFSADTYLNILAISKAIDAASHGEGIGPAVTIATASVTGTGATVTEALANSGVEFVTTLPELVKLNIGVGSADDWAGNVNNDYTFFLGADILALSATGVTFGVDVNYETADSSLGFGADAKVVFAPVTVGVGFDLDGEAYELGAGFAFALGEGKSVDTGLFGKEYAEGLAVGFSMDNNSAMDATVSFFDGALIPVVDLTAYAALVDLTGTMVYGIGADVRATVENIVPYATMALLQDTSLNLNVGATVSKLADINGAAEAASLTLGVKYLNQTAFNTGVDTLEVSAALASFVPLTTFTLKYATTDLETDNGAVTFETKIAF